MAQSFSYLL